MHFWCILLVIEVTKAGPCSRQTSSLNGRSIKELVAICITEEMIRTKSRNKEEEEHFFFQRMSYTIYMNYKVHGI